MIKNLAIRDGMDRKKGPRRRFVSIEEFSSYKWPSYTFNKDWDE